MGLSLDAVGHGIMLGAIRSASAVGSSETDAIEMVARFGLQETVAFGGDLEAIAAGLAAGAVEGSREAGGGPESYLTAMTEGARQGLQHTGFNCGEAIERGGEQTRGEMFYSHD